ncbi:hypothetical protein CRG98_050357, partial [Punica granatum]
CRHKIEKLRRRYRAEKQRCASYSGRVFSSWDLFHLIDSIEAGSEPEILVPKTRGKKNLRDGDDDFDPSYDFGSSFGGGAKTPADRNEVVLGLSATNPPKIDRNFVSNFNVGQNRGGRIHRAVSDYDYGGGRDYASPIPLGVRLRHRTADSLDPDYHGSRYPSKAIGGGNMGSLGLRPKKHRRTDEMLDSDDDDSVESDEEMAFRPSSSFRPENGRAQAPVGRKINPFTEIASSIKMLGDEFVRMEKMKMEMAREFEKTRMRFEMKRNEMIIKSEQMIISAVIEAVHENKKSCLLLVKIMSHLMILYIIVWSENISTASKETQEAERHVGTGRKPPNEQRLKFDPIEGLGNAVITLQLTSDESQLKPCTDYVHPINMSAVLRAPLKPQLA